MPTTRRIARSRSGWRGSRRRCGRLGSARRLWREVARLRPPGERAAPASGAAGRPADPAGRRRDPPVHAPAQRASAAALAVRLLSQPGRRPLLRGRQRLGRRLARLSARPPGHAPLSDHRLLCRVRRRDALAEPSARSPRQRRLVPHRRCRRGPGLSTRRAPGPQAAHGASRPPRRARPVHLHARHVRRGQACTTWPIGRATIRSRSARCFDRAGYIQRDASRLPVQDDRRRAGVPLPLRPQAGRRVSCTRCRWSAGRKSCATPAAPTRCTRSPLAPETGVLLHFKFMADFIDRARIEAERKQYWQGAKRYTEFSRRMAGRRRRSTSAASSPSASCPRHSWSSWA